MPNQNAKISVGGQAVIEGVFMRSPSKCAIALRKPSGSIIVESEDNIAWTKRHPALGVPFVRGIVTLAETLGLGLKAITRSADVSLESEGQKINKAEYGFSFFISFGFAFLLFFVLPAFVFSKLKAVGLPTISLNIIEGLLRISIFLAFLFAVSFMADMKRIFEYHGAEHKSIHLYEQLSKEKNEEIKSKLTADAARRFSREHPSCGTSFIIVVLLISIIVFSFLGRPSFLMRVAYKLSLLPVIVGLSYEFIKFSSRRKENPLIKVLITPGLLLQKLTTREPSNDQIEVAIEALKAVI